MCFICCQAGTFHSRAERDIYLTVKFWSKKNFLADSRDLREHLSSAGNGTAVRVVGSSKRYKEVNEFSEVISALINFGAANRELWPMDQVGRKSLGRLETELTRCFMFYFRHVISCGIHCTRMPCWLT